MVIAALVLPDTRLLRREPLLGNNYTEFRNAVIQSSRGGAGI